MGRRLMIAIGSGLTGILLVGCSDTYLGRMLSLRGIDVQDYRYLPYQNVANGPNVVPLPEAKDPQWTRRAFAAPLSDPTAFDRFAASNGTTAFIVLAEGKVVAERYYNGYRRDSLFKSFSISKSVLSALFGIAQADGVIARTDRIGDHVPGLRPELADVRLGHLLDNVSGFRFQRGAMPWRQQPRMYYSRNIRAYLRQTQFAARPGERFEGEDLSPLFVGLALEAALRRRDPQMTISKFASTRLWQPMGATFPAIWTVDRPVDGMEKVESGLTARAIDFARFGQLYLDGGKANGRMIVPADWIETTTTPPGEGRPNRFVDSDGHYRNLWWGASRRVGVAQRFYANGHFGQRIFIAPDKKLVIVRLGSRAGEVDWTKLIIEMADRW